MFSTRPQIGGADGALQDAAGGVLGKDGAAAQALANPWIGAAGAGALFLLAVAGLIAVTGDPRAGAPHVRISLLQGPDHPLAGPDLAAPAPVTGPAAPAGPAGAVQALAPAPFSGLTAPGPGGLLPIIGPGGTTPAQAYARPFHDTGAPKVALVIGGLGLNAKTTRQAIEDLPPEVTLSFVPYAEGLQGWIDLARANGHEVLLEAPMEPLDYPQNDPGPYTLMAQDPAQETVKRLETLLSRATGYFGVTNYLGGRFLASDSAMAAFAGALHQRGLGFIDDGSAAGRGGAEPRASAERVIDQDLDGASIDQQLAALEASAQQHGKALASGFSYPVTLQEVQRWAMGLQ
ncbi:MAG TPA: divergent polysaccharide deacetylase family protein, partial [Caulobacteraceae bacterium]|nr:divergent polysaccharide deacetylase family protein [Caulobacteraceae bacterium]